jgi:hypothetical protein
MDLPWDSSRCMRLLRPLRAHLSALEREHQRKLDVKSARVTTKATSAKSVNDQSPDWFGRAAARSKRFKKPKTYSSRSRPQPFPPVQSDSNQPAQNAVTGQVHMPDAFRMQSRDCSTPDRAQVCSHASTVNQPAIVAQQPKVSRRKKYVKSFHGVRPDDNVGGFVKSYLAIDLATQPDAATRGTRGTREAVVEDDRPRGAPSLRAMSIRSIAYYIERGASSQLSVSVEERIDISEEVYDDLDDIPFCREAGLPIQAQLVRAHATRIVCNALRVQLLGARAGFRIVSKLGRESIAEQELILGAIAYGIRPDDTLKNCLRDPMVPHMHGLLETSKRLSNDFWPYSPYVPKTILTQLIRNPTFPIDWMSTPAYQDQWQHLVMDISSHSTEYHNSRHFMNRMFRAACGVMVMSSKRNHSLQHVPVIGHGISTWEHGNCDNCSHRSCGREQRTIRNAFTNSITSLLTILTSLIIVGSEEYSTSGYEESNPRSQITHKINLLEIRSFLHEMASEVLEWSPQDWMDDKKNALFFGSRCAAVLFCTLLAEAVSTSPVPIVSHNQQSLVHMILALEDSFDPLSEGDITLLDDLPALLANICSAASQVSTISATVWLESVVEALTSLSTLSKRSQGFIQQLCRETAQEMGITLPGRFTNGGSKSLVNVQRTPAKENLHPMVGGWDGPGYRWEPMLSEWVSATPARLPKSSPCFPQVYTQECGSGVRATKRTFRAVEVQIPPRTTVPRQKITSNALDSLQQSRILRGRPGVVVIDDSYTESDSDATGFSSPAKVTAGSMIMIDVFVPPNRPQSHIRRISDLITSSSPVTPPLRTNIALLTGPHSPPPTPTVRRPTEKRSQQVASQSSRVVHDRKAKRTRQSSCSAGSDFEEVSADDQSLPKRRCTRLAEKATIHASTNRRNIRHQRESLYWNGSDSEVDELSVIW